ncbi:MAG: SbmA/BacA-like family transporter [Pseudomonadota bacterium]
MSDKKAITIHSVTWRLLAGHLLALARSEVGGKARWLFATLVLLLFGVSALNVLNSYVGRDFMTAIEARDMPNFVRMAVIYVLVFGLSTVMAVFYRFTEERLGLLWRAWLTRRLVHSYLTDHTYYRLKIAGTVENPDERIADDVRTFTATTLSFGLMILNGSITVAAFSGVMWSISPLLFIVTVLYAALGSYFTIKLGHPLVDLNYNQFDKEANFRSTLIHVRENAESIALSRRETRLSERLLGRIEDFKGNFRRIISVNRNLGFFTTGYNYLIQVIPALVVAPMFIQGEAAFGVISQSSMAFAHLVGAFSLIITQFQLISSYAAVTARLNLMGQAIDQLHEGPKSRIEVVEAGGRIAYERLTLRSADDQRVLLRNLSLSVPSGMRLLITGPNEAAKVALFRATANIWYNGEGRIVRPSLDCIRFLPERPYLYPGSLRELLLRSGDESSVSETRILDALNTLGIQPILKRAGGLDVEQDWVSILSLGEEQLLAFTRLLLAAPTFAFLDRVCTALSPEDAHKILKALSDHAITYITLEEAEGLLEHYDAVLEIAMDGAWSLKRTRAGQIVEDGAIPKHNANMNGSAQEDSE